MEPKITQDGLYEIQLKNGNTMLISPKGLSEKLFNLQFFYDEVLGEIGWDDELEESKVDPTSHCVDEIRDLRKQVKRLQGSLALRTAAQQSVHPTKAIRCACGGEMLANYRCQNCGLASPL